MSREDAIKAGKVECLTWDSTKLFLYWEVWSEAPVKPCFIVEMTLGHGAIRVKKYAFVTFEEADAKFREICEEYAVEIARRALGLKPTRNDTVKIGRVPKFH